MENEKIKEILLDIRDSSFDFTVIQSGDASKRVNGLYKPDTREIILHNKNFQNDNQLIYTAVHEYTHHIQNEDALKASGGRQCLNTSRAHTNAFWALFHELLEIAEQKGYYKIEWELSPELKALTEKIKTEYLQKNGELMIEFGRALIEARELCEKANIRYEDYIDRVLQLPRTTARTIRTVSVQNLDPAVGFENMKLLASVKAGEKRDEAAQKIAEGKSPDTIRSMLKRKATEVDEKTKLEREKARLEKTIKALSQRLEYIEESLSSISN